MGIIRDNKKFNTKTEQKNPTNPEPNVDDKLNQVDTNKKTIKKQQNKQ